MDDRVISGPAKAPGRRTVGPVLALDTSAERAGAALAFGDGSRPCRAVFTKARRGEDLADVVETLLAAEGVAAADLDGLAVVTGPGSYTGLRIGLALVRGLAFVDRTPVVTLGSLELGALACPTSGAPVVVLLAAPADRVFVGAYQREADVVTTLAEPAVMGIDEVVGWVESLPSNWVVCAEKRSSCASLWRELARPPGVVGRIVELAGDRIGLLAETACRRLVAGGGVRASEVTPVYVGTSKPRRNRNRVALDLVPED